MVNLLGIFIEFLITKVYWNLKSGILLETLIEFLKC